MIKFTEFEAGLTRPPVRPSSKNSRLTIDSSSRRPKTGANVKPEADILYLLAGYPLRLFFVCILADLQAYIQCWLLEPV